MISASDDCGFKALSTLGDLRPLGTYKNRKFKEKIEFFARFFYFTH